jgi:hypothetical protein
MDGHQVDLGCGQGGAHDDLGDETEEHPSFYVIILACCADSRATESLTVRRVGEPEVAVGDAQFYRDAARTSYAWT